jgi:hypothetical protein
MEKKKKKKKKKQKIENRIDRKAMAEGGRRKGQRTESIG